MRPKKRIPIRRNTPGHAPADTVASAPILNQLWTSEGVAQVTQQLMEARRGDPKVQLFPEITVGIIGEDYLRAGQTKAAIEVFKLDLLAFRTLLMRTVTLPMRIWQTDQGIWHGSMPKRPAQLQAEVCTFKSERRRRAPMSRKVLAGSAGDPTASEFASDPDGELQNQRNHNDAFGVVEQALRNRVPDVHNFVADLTARF